MSWIEQVKYFSQMGDSESAKSNKRGAGLFYAAAARVYENNGWNSLAAKYYLNAAATCDQNYSYSCDHWIKKASALFAECDKVDYGVGVVGFSVDHFLKIKNVSEAQKTLELFKEVVEKHNLHDAFDEHIKRQNEELSKLLAPAQ